VFDRFAVFIVDTFCRISFPDISNFGMTNMIRNYFWTFAFLCCSGLAAAQPLQSSPGPACLYESKSYSEGAFICVQKSLMLTCSFDGTRAAWKVVADRDISERCVNPVALSVPPAPRKYLHRAHMIRHRVNAVGINSAKCFTFNGRQYCE
jgi:hypothetical protein